MMKEPNYKGIWRNPKKEFSLFYLWMNEEESKDNSGIGWEKFKEKLIMSKIYNLKKNEREISFNSLRKEYILQKGCTIEEKIFFKGHRAFSYEPFYGIWKTEKNKGKDSQGLFHIADNPMSKNLLSNLLAEVYEKNFERELKTLQEQYPDNPLF